MPIYRLEIENFFSIRDAQVLDLTVAPNVPDDESRFAPIFPGSKLRAPKVVALYGANASGKTNILRALEFLIAFVRDSAQRNIPGFALERFNDDASCSRPIRLALELGGVMDLTPETAAKIAAGDTADIEYGTYRYEVAIEVVKGNTERILSESLRQRPGGTGKWQRVFERDGEGEAKGSRWMNLTLKTLRPNVSLLSHFALFQHPTAAIFVQAAHQAAILIGSSESSSDGFAINYLNNTPAILDQLNLELSRIDIGVEQLRFEHTPNGPRALFKHQGLQVEMPWMLESHGTRAFIRMYPVLAATLANGGIAVLDEFDLAIHPLVLPEILRWFYRKDRNAEDAQLWFSCHSASLMDELKKEEIVICNKDMKGRTTFHSLMDVKVRRDDNHYKKYLSGVYGGVPVIG
jgi:uncharacterized protein